MACKPLKEMGTKRCCFVAWHCINPEAHCQQSWEKQNNLICALVPSHRHKAFKCLNKHLVPRSAAFVYLVSEAPLGRKLLGGLGQYQATLRPIQKAHQPHQQRSLSQLFCRKTTPDMHQIWSHLPDILFYSKILPMDFPRTSFIHESPSPLFLISILILL